MKIDIVMPKMGESLQEGTITKWLKKVGDLVERDEMILEISTDKVDTEVPSPNAGKLVEIITNEGETVEVGSVIARIETDATATISTVVSAPAPSVQAAPVVIAENPKTVEIITPKVMESPKAISGSSTIEVVMPKMGESLQEGTVIKWLKKVGDKVERDEMILEISTDKVDTEVPSPVAGILSEIIAEEGQTVEVGVVIAKISTSGTVSVAQPTTTNIPPAPVSQVSSAQPTTPQVVIPTEGTKEIPARKGDKFYSPVVRKIAMETGITLEELEQIKGSGIENRINKDDLLNYIANRSTSKSVTASNVTTVSETPKAIVSQQVKTSTPINTVIAPTINFASGDDVEVIPMDRIRKLISDHMVYSKHTSAHVTSVSEVDVTNIVNYREKHKNEFEKREGFKLTFTPFFIKAAVDAIKQFPMVNVSVDGKNILRHKRINLGFATALPDGNLIVPVIKNSEILNLTGLARSVYDLATRARSKKLNPDDIQGGTFTLTNVGTFGTLFGTPVINQPQCGIFGVGAIKKRPVVKEVEGNDLILVRHMMYASITYDHRVIDGMLAGQALAAFVKSMESMNEQTITM